MRTGLWLAAAVAGGAALLPAFRPGGTGVGTSPAGDGPRLLPGLLASASPIRAPTPGPSPVPSSPTSAPAGEPTGATLRVLAIPFADRDAESPSPIADADLELQDAEGRVHFARTDDGGMAVFAGLPPGGWVLVGRAGDQAACADRTEVPKEFLVEGQGRNYSLEFTRAVLLRGRVLDAASGAPLSGATVEAWIRRLSHAYGAGCSDGPARPEGEWPSGVVVTGGKGLLRPSGGRVAIGVAGADGEFSLALQRGAGIVLVARTPGFAQRALIPGGDGEPVEFRLPAAGAMEGRVLGPDGSPVEGAGVFAFPGDARACVEPPEAWASPAPDVAVAAPAARSGPDGRWRIEGLPVDEALLLVAERAGIGRSLPVEDAWIPGPGDVVERDLHLERWPRLTVRWEGPGPAGDERFGIHLVPAGEAWPSSTALVPDGTGSWGRETLAPGRWSVRAVSLRLHST